MAPMWLLLCLCLVGGGAGAGGRTCDGSRHIPAAYVEDDYCDCADGSDETTTGACADTLFTCPNVPYTPTELFSSRVNDGICDCCDGADEFSGLCRNECIALARASLEALSRALEQKRRLSKESHARIERAAIELAGARAELSAASPTLTRLADAVAAAETAEAAARAAWNSRVESNELARSLGIDGRSTQRLSHGMLGVAIVRLALWGGVDGVDEMVEIMRSQSTELMEEVDDADVLEVALEARDAARAGEGAGEGAGRTQSESQSESRSTADLSLTPACTPPHALCAHEAQLASLLPLETLTADSLREVLEAMRTHQETVPPFFFF